MLHLNIIHIQHCNKFREIERDLEVKTKKKSVQF